MNLGEGVEPERVLNLTSFKKLVKRDEKGRVANPFDIIERLKKNNDELNCNLSLVSQKVCGGVHRVVTDKLIAETAVAMAAENPNYAYLGKRFLVSNLHENTKPKFSETIKDLHETGIIANDVYNFVIENAEKLDNAINPEMDYQYDYVGLKILERSYLLKIEGKVVETPQYMLMRVAVGIHKNDIESVLETYKLTSEGYFTHASSILLNAGTCTPQLSSSYLLSMNADSIEGIYGTLKESAVISESAGGIGVSIHDIRSSGSYIGGTTETSGRIIPLMRLFNDTARFVDEEGRRRKSAITVYLEPWHIDVEKFLDLKKKYGKEEERARDLFYALWVPDLFMERVKTKGNWSLFCPSEASELADVWGPDFVTLYTKYEKEGKAKRVVNAKDLWTKVLQSQIETGTPYVLFKDLCNRKSNQNIHGTIKSSSLCAEIIEYTSRTEAATCSMASIALPLCVKQKDAESESQPSKSKLLGSRDSDQRCFDFKKLAEITSFVTKSLNKIIDVNHFVVDSAKVSSKKRRPIGIGVQGLADTFVLLGITYDSDEARKLNRHIFETIYYHALEASCELAKEFGVYEEYNGSPVSKGKLQQDMWTVELLPLVKCRCNWNTLRDMIKENGVRNSLLVALMPTATTSQILGNNECFAPFTSNIYSHKGSCTSFVVLNKHLLHDLISMNCWSPDLQNQIISKDGSVQNIPDFPDSLKPIYKTVWEIDQIDLVDMAAERGRYIDQSQSLSIHMDKPGTDKLSELLRHAWSKELKTGMYRLRSRDAIRAMNFRADDSLL